ncbi:MAG: hypothetical protein B5766_05465 [Candidatus Lumbricidophila eiseniae]|uniref:Uncharacterized protein n=1 Tax=Candidatus Lumbricidiphila eiseniae TaxID=1969409 RepID=A0A2A6FRK7_9MICO|nr:MAG: hypothetical protein B5766_05465 [Candidatus Lumbricidophila eiseniae]
MGEIGLFLFPDADDHWWAFGCAVHAGLGVRARLFARVRDQIDGPVIAHVVFAIVDLLDGDDSRTVNAAGNRALHGGSEVARFEPVVSVILSSAKPE